MLCVSAAWKFYFGTYGPIYGSNLKLIKYKYLYCHPRQTIFTITSTNNLALQP